MSAQISDQTVKLMNSLPHLSEMLRRADKQESGYSWTVVRWSGKRPDEVTQADVEVVPPSVLGVHEKENGFSSRTRDLRFNADWVKEHYPGRMHTERGHWGVWRLQDDGSQFYQTVIPLSNSGELGKPLATGKPATPTTPAMVRLSEWAHTHLKLWSEQDGKSIQEMLETALREYDRQRFFDEADAAYRRLKADPAAWEEEVAERRVLEGSLMDGLHDPDEVDWESIVMAGESQSA